MIEATKAEVESMVKRALKAMQQEFGPKWVYQNADGAIVVERSLLGPVIIVKSIGVLT